MKKQFDVDIVITWVDGADKNWLQEKNKYLDNEHQIDIDASVKRYRDWDNLQYIFRGIEKFAPWVHRVYLVTNGQLPKWLNTKNGKLVLVNHKDYIPAEYLPTFSARAIGLNMHHIQNLSEHFVYMNDDFFFLKPLKKNDFFDKNGLPKIVALEKPNCVGNFIFDNNLMNNVRVLSKVFNKQQVKRQNKHKWYPINHPVCALMNRVNDLVKGGWVGFYNDHLPSPLLKSGIEKCWELFSDDLHKTSLNKFRTIYDVNPFIFTDYLLCSGKFSPDKFGRKGKLFNLCDVENSNIQNCCELIKKQKHKMICLNDDIVKLFAETKKRINDALQLILPEKSSFEI